MIPTYEQFLMESQKDYDRYRLPQHLIDEIDDVDVRKHLMNNDPDAGNNLAIRQASKYGHKEIVKLLLQDPRVDPAADDNEAILRASEWGQTEIVRLLAQHFCDEELVLTDEELGDIIDNTENAFIDQVIKVRNKRDEGLDRATDNILAF